MDSNQNTTDTYLSFYLGQELFGSDVKQILEVLRDEQITDIPRSQDFIKGIINFRGEIVTIIDLFVKLNMTTQTRKNKPIIIVFELLSNEKNVKIGVLVEKVKKVFEMNKKEQLPIPEFGKYYNPEYLTGVAKVNDEFVMLLDIEKVLSDEEVQLILDTNN